jgi:PAS domain S-box-containing protein
MDTREKPIKARLGMPALAEEQLERRVAERMAELAKSMALLETVTSNAPVILFATDAQGVFTVHAGKAIPATGRQPGEIIGKDYQEVLSHNPQAQDNFRRVLNGEAFTAVVEGPEDTAFETRYRPLRDAEGKITGMIGLSLDITERKRAEEAVRQATEEVQDLYNNAPCGYHSLDKDGLFLRINDTELQWLGYAREEVVGKLRFTDVLTEKTKHLFAENYPRLKATGLVRDVEYELVRKDGSVLPVLLSATAVRDEDGNYVMSRSTAYDMTEIERAREAVKSERQKFNDILEMLPAYLVLLTPDYHVPFANRFFRERFGESNGKRCYEYLFGRSEPCEICETYTVLKTKAPHRWEWTGPDSRNYDISDFPFTDTDGSTLILEMGIDITERKRAEQGFRHLNRALRTISECNQALVRAREESELLQEICRILVEEGGYRLAWVGYAEQDEAKSVRPAAYAGVEEGYLETLKITWADTERGRGPTGTAIRTGQPSVCRDTLEDPNFVPWREEAIRRGYASSISLPFVLDGQPAGALMLYSRTADAFDTAETQLLTELANDLAYGIRTLRTRAERQKAEEALRRNEERYRALVVATSQMVWTTNAQGEVVGDLPGWRAYSGQSEEEVKGWGWVNALHPEDHQKTAAIWSQAVETRSLYNTEYRVRRHDGEYRHFAVRGVPVLEPDGSVREWVGTCTDITERKAASDALRWARDYNRSLIEASLDPLVTISPEGKITDVNRATERVTGSSREELIGTDFCDYFTDPEKARAGYEQVFREGWAQDYALDVQHRDGHVTPVVYNASLYRDEAGQVIGVFAAAREVTERKRMEEELRQLSGRLLEVQDEERRRIARELHDSTTQNLAAVALNLSLLKEATEKDAGCWKYLSESISLTELSLNELRNISYLLHPPLLDEMGLSSALAYYVDGFSRRSGISTALEISPELGRLPKDAERTLFRVVQESLTNILRHAGSPTARIAIVQTPEGVVLEVVDRGRGMLTSSASKPGGTPARPGIGIPGMRERVRLIGGQLEIDSGAQGTTVRVTLPFSETGL